MKVLFACHRVPYPPKRGGKIRPFNIIRHLTGRGHEVTVASLARTPQEMDEAADLSKHCQATLIECIPNAVAWPRMVAWLPTPKPSSFAYFHSPRLARRVNAALETGAFDMVFAHCSSAAPYVAHAKVGLKVLDYGDMDSQKWREYVHYKPFPLSAGYRLEAAKLERAERQLARQFDLCTCTTRAEMQSLRDLGVSTPTAWFPNGVDGAFFSPEKTYDPDLVSFIGRMDYFPNQQGVQFFCKEVLPALRQRRPDVRFEIVGADPPPFIRDLAKLPGVSVTGSVPDVRPYVQKAALTVAPLEIARGTQNKILESMAMGVPVVCSEQAAGGVDAVPGEHILVARTPGDYVEAILQILQSSETRNRLAASARARVLSNHTWASSMRQLDELLNNASRRKGNEPALFMNATHPSAESR